MKVAYPWFGGKSQVSRIVWDRFGDVHNYVEPFFGGGAVLLQRPSDHIRKVETINDIDGFVANFWRALKHDPESVAHWADNPVNENDLHARHKWLIINGKDLSTLLEEDPDYYDAKVAGWWVWGISCWIGSGWCDLTATISRQRPDMGCRGVHRRRSALSRGFGVNRTPDEEQSRLDMLIEFYNALCERFDRVRVCCGDWTRVTSPAVTTHISRDTGMFLDPPYERKHRADCYNYETDVAHAVREYAIQNGDKMKIALCGYESDTHPMPEDWECFAWKTRGGLSNIGNGQGKANKHLERVWFSPLCKRKDMV